VKPAPISTAVWAEYCMEEALRDMVRVMADAEADLLEAVGRGLIMSRYNRLLAASWSNSCDDSLNQAWRGPIDESSDCDRDSDSDGVGERPRWSVEEYGSF
jgi:hypothetical protein